MKLSSLPSALILPLSAQSQAVDFAPLEKCVLEELEATNTPGASVAIVSGDRVVFAKGFGIASIETGAPVTPELLFRVGSITKMFTASVLVALAEAKDIDLDAPIGDYIKGLNPELSAVTVHQLLSHTAGMTDESPSDYGSHDDSALAAYVRSLKEDHFFTDPGAIFSYSNPGFDVAGFLIEQLGGRPFADQMSERLFEPLGMRRTTFRPTVAMTYPLSQGHSLSAEAKPSVLRPFGDNVAGWPDGFMLSNVHDLARFAIAFMNGGRIEGKQVLHPSTIARLSGPHTDLPSRFGFDGGQYGYGLFVHDHRGSHMVWHAGLCPGFGALLQMVPAQRFAVIVLGNRSGALLNKTAEKAMELMLPLDPKVEVESRRALPISETEIREFVGTYANKPESVELLLEGEALVLRRNDRGYPVVKTGPLRFAIVEPGESEPEEFVLVPDSDGKVAYLHIGRHALKRVPLRDR